MSDVKVGRAAPEVALTCIGAGEPEPRSVRLSDFSGRWLVLIFYPRDFSFVCPTELTAFSARLADFSGRGCDLLGVSVDSIELHREWLATPPADGGLGPLQFPLASDGEGKMARAYGVWVDEQEVSTRGLFIIDPDGILQYSVVHNLSVGRTPDEVLRVLDALRTGGLCPASWTSADGTIDPEGALRPGRILGHYRIRQKLGGGSFGTVFAAWDLRLERMVALKVLKRNIFESREAVLAEARAAAKLSHPNVCTVYAVEEQDGLPVIAMEYLDGQPLAGAVTGAAPAATLTWATQIALGLAAAHQQHVVHGDLKPANIIVTEEGTAKIVDFGLASSHRSSRSPASETPAGDTTADVVKGVVDLEATIAEGELTAGQPVGIQGTPAYMSPEQAAGLPATAASDVFAFGLTLVEMLTGRQAVAEHSSVEWLLRLRSQDLAAEVGPQVDEAYRGLVTLMLARDPARRPEMSEVARLLSAGQSGERSFSDASR